MASGKGNFLSNKLLDYLFNATAYTVPSALDVELYTATPGASGGGTEVSTSGTAYARQVYNFTGVGGGWTAASSQQVSNESEIDWATATANWGTVVAVSLKETTNNNIWYWGTLTSSRVVNTGDSVRFAIGGLVVAES